MKKNLSGIASQPFMPYLRPEAFLPFVRGGTPTLPGPNWHRGPAIAFELPPDYNTDYLDEEGNMSYGRIGDVPFSTVVGPVRAPNASFYRPSPVGPWPQGPAPYIPQGLPGPIYPGPGWNFGPSVAAKRGNEYVVSTLDTSHGMQYGAEDRVDADVRDGTVAPMSLTKALMYAAGAYVLYQVYQTHFATR
jgi:hypothetical protein